VVLADGDRVAFFQLRSMLEGVVARGTAASIRNLAQYVGGKTGTTDNENDAWFVGFTGDVTVAVWVGYDNSRGKRTLGRGETGGRVSVPIFETIVQASWTHVAPKSPLPPPSADTARQLKPMPIDLNSGQRVAAKARDAFQEYFRIDRHKRVRDTRHALVDRRHAIARHEPRPAPPEAQSRLGPPSAAPAPAAGPERPPRTLRALFGL
jgi:membrane carboxypeptidase/penicillin-binding protein